MGPLPGYNLGQRPAGCKAHNCLQPDSQSAQGGEAPDGAHTRANSRLRGEWNCSQSRSCAKCAWAARRSSSVAWENGVPAGAAGAMNASGRAGETLGTLGPTPLAYCCCSCAACCCCCCCGGGGGG